MSAQPPPARSPRRTRAEQAEFYEHLVQTSLQLFSEGGYEAISMRRLASEVGIPPMSLYRYFPTKAHLIRHVWDHILERALHHSMRDDKRTRSPLERLRAFIDGFLGYWLEHRDHYWVVFAVRDNLGGLHTEEDVYVLGPNPLEILQTLESLFDACLTKRPLPPSQRKAALDLILCKTLGFLLGTIGLASLRWTDLQLLKEQLLDDIEDQVRQVAGAKGGSPVSRLAPRVPGPR
jgi:AcrR family transcriptional regulator